MLKLALGFAAVYWCCGTAGARHVSALQEDTPNVGTCDGGRRNGVLQHSNVAQVVSGILAIIQPVIACPLYGCDCVRLGGRTWRSMAGWNVPQYFSKRWHWLRQECMNARVIHHITPGGRCRPVTSPNQVLMRKARLHKARLRNAGRSQFGMPRRLEGRFALQRSVWPVFVWQ